MFLIIILSNLICIMQNQHSEMPVQSQNTRQGYYKQVFTQKLKQNYDQALKFSNLKLEEQIFYRDLSIGQGDHIHEIYTKEQNTRPHLVILHGFGGTSLFSIRLFQHLHSKFNTHALDTFGVGLSTRGNWKQNMTPQQVVSYYVEAIQKWRINANITSFILLGHSFGAYIGTLYLRTYSKNVQGLILLSPPGLVKHSEQQIRAKMQQRRVMNCIASSLYNKNITPTGMARNCLFGNIIINRLLKRLHITEEQHEIWKYYIMHLSKQQLSSQMGFYILFTWPLQPYIGLDDTLSKISQKVKIDILFGDVDWMDKEPAFKLKDKYNNIKVHIVEKATHQLIFDNPKQVCRIVIDSLS